MRVIQFQYGPHVVETTKKYDKRGEVTKARAARSLPF
jgi:hypothetical protein